MGKWNYRWLPRNKYRQQSSDFCSYQTLSPDDWNSNVPSWEKQFCFTVGSVPWKKVLIAKKYMHCHDSVVKWNDSANKEAFNNAKNRYQADMDGLPFDIPLPDPDIFVDEIDWNPDIDPRLIADLEKEYFNPDDGEIIKKIEKVEHISGSNPWEGNDNKATEAPVIQGWNHGDDCIGEETNNRRRNNATENPWEQSNNNVNNGAPNDSTWLSCSDKSWGWKQKGEVHDERLWSNNFNSQSRWQNNYKSQNQLNNDRDCGWGQQPGRNIERHNLNSSRGGAFSSVGQWKKRERVLTSIHQGINSQGFTVMIALGIVTGEMEIIETGWSFLQERAIWIFSSFGILKPNLFAAFSGRVQVSCPKKKVLKGFQLKHGANTGHFYFVRRTTNEG